MKYKETKRRKSAWVTVDADHNISSSPSGASASICSWSVSPELWRYFKLCLLYSSVLCLHSNTPVSCVPTVTRWRGHWCPQWSLGTTQGLLIKCEVRIMYHTHTFHLNFYSELCQAARLKQIFKNWMFPLVRAAPSSQVLRSRAWS